MGYTYIEIMDNDMGTAGDAVDSVRVPSNSSQPRSGTNRDVSEGKDGREGL
jgi:hypothetical protein